MSTVLSSLLIIGGGGEYCVLYNEKHLEQAVVKAMSLGTFFATLKLMK
jgi:hypothetical protein